MKNGKDIRELMGQAKSLSNLKALAPPRPGQLTELDRDEMLLEDIKRINTVRMKTGDFNNSLPVVDVSIPETVDIACPLIGDVRIHANRCPGCPNYRGIFQKSWANDQYLYWSQKYGIRCERVAELHCGETI